MVLNHKMKGSKGPYVDFSVWGPYGDRAAKHMRTIGQVFVGNMLTDRQIHGPHGYDGWICCWKVFRYAALSLNIASPGAIDDYSEGIHRLVLEFPHAWPIIYSADDIVRGECWRDLYRELGKKNKFGH